MILLVIFSCAAITYLSFFFEYLAKGTVGHYAVADAYGSYLYFWGHLALEATCNAYAKLASLDDKLSFSLGLTEKTKQKSIGKERKV